jgi:superkiller protein 3
MPGKSNNAVGSLKLMGLKDKTAAYLGEIERYVFDPILPLRAGRFTAEVRRQRSAESELSAAVQRAPESPAAYKYLGVLFLRKEEFDKAEQYLNQSLKRTTRPDVLTLLGVTKFRLDKLQPARRTFQRAIATDSSFKEAYYNLALTYAYNRLDKVISLLGEALKIDSTYAAAHRELGWTLKQRGQYSDAERHIKKAIKSDKSEGWAYIYLGNLMWSKAKLTEAERAYKTAIKTWPAEGTPYWCLADFYKDNGRLQEAEALYRRAVRLDPEDSVAHGRLGLYLKQMGKLKMAERHLERALTLDPTFEKVKAALEELN